MTNSKKPSIGIIGAGRLGTAIARQALKAGYSVRIANSKGPETLGLILSVLLPGAQASAVEGVVEQSDVVILALPLDKYKSLRPHMFVGKVVIDAMNYWPPTQGYIKEFANEHSTSSEVIQQYLPDATVVKTLNHVAYSEIEDHGLPAGSNNRRAVAMAGNETRAKQQVADFVNDLGFDSVDLGDLPEGRRFQPGTQLFNARYGVSEIRHHTKV